MEVSGERDILLFRRSQSGEEEAFAALYRRWQGAIYRYALRLTGSASIAEEITQEVFMALMGRVSGFDPERGSFSAYLYGMARHHVLRQGARKGLFTQVSKQTAEKVPEMQEARDLQPDALSLLARQERIDLLHRAVAALPFRYREVVVLCELQELNYTEAAQVIGCPEGTIRSRLHRARILLVDKLHEMPQAESRIPGIEPARCML